MPEDLISVGGYVAVRDFIDWLYEEAPPEAIALEQPRERLLAAYTTYKAETSMAASPARYVPANGLLPLLRSEE